MAKVWKPPLVEVAWLDASGYHELNGTRADMIVRGKLVHRLTGGYLIHQDSEVEQPNPLLRRTILAHDYDHPVEAGDEPEVGNLTIIPSLWVTKIIYKIRQRKAVKTSASNGDRPENPA